MEQINELLTNIQAQWDETFPIVIANQASWPTLPDDAPNTVTTTLELLSSIVKDVSEYTRKGRAVRLALPSAITHLSNARTILNKIQAGQYDQLANLLSFLGHASSAIYGIYMLSSKDGESKLRAACLQFETIIQEYGDIFQVLNDTSNKATETNQHLSQLVSDAEVRLGEIVVSEETAKEALTTIQSLETSATKTLDEINANSEAIDVLHKDAEKLRDDIEERINAAEEAENLMTELSDRAKQVREELESLLPGATSSRLATAYTMEKDRVANRMRTQFIWFCIGLISLVLTIYIGHRYFGSLPQEPIALALQLLSRAMMATPAIWFTWVSARQYTYLSRLHTDYGFKESVSTSFEGYRQMMRELDEADNKELTSLLSIDAIRVISSDPDRLKQKEHGDESPVSHLARTVLDRLFKNKEKSKSDAEED